MYVKKTRGRESILLLLLSSHEALALTESQLTLVICVLDMLSVHYVYPIGLYYFLYYRIDALIDTYSALGPKRAAALCFFAQDARSAGPFSPGSGRSSCRPCTKSLYRAQAIV